MSEGAAKPIHTVSVHDLVEFVLRRGDLRGEREFVGSDRALAGIRGVKRGILNACLGVGRRKERPCHGNHSRKTRPIHR
jgi:hypothetical protein